MELSYRKLDASGDYTFGQGKSNFHQNSPETVAQAVKTRLALFEGEWFLDITKGTPYNSKILGMGTVNVYDSAIQEVIVNTVGVTGIVQYSSSVDPSTRKASVNCVINTVFGRATVVQYL